jgi:hypothetical protein
MLGLAAIAALAHWGVRAGRSLPADVTLGLGVPLLAAVLCFAAPKSSRRLHGRALVAVEMTVFCAAVAALADAGRPLVAGGFGVVVAANAVSMHLL